MLTVAKIDRYDIVNNICGDKPSLTIWFSGCSMHCDGCQNTTLWDRDNGVEYEVDGLLIDPIVNECKSLDIDTVVLLGGEPLEQDIADLLKLVTELKRNGLNIWLYTGKEFDEVPVVIKDYCSVIKTGKYIDALKKDGFPASSNQSVWVAEGRYWVKYDTIGGKI